MKNKNEHVEQFLTYYCSLAIAPEYAVLLRGKWGAGKTWFVKRFIKMLESNGGKSLYISLYGITSFEGIENEFFRQLHPVLSSKGMALAGKLAKGLLKTTIKVDLDGDGRDDVSVASNVPDVKLPEYLTNTENFVLIFDDLERCTIPVCDLLGYINHFVEQNGYKVILVANEEEILSREEGLEDHDPAYRRIKEKLIGKTFEVESDLSGAMKTFFDLIESDLIRKVFENNLQMMQSLYLASGYNNLRHLRQALLDLERLLVSLPKIAIGRDDVLTRILQIYLIYSFELKSGSMKEDDISFANDFYSVFRSMESDDSQNVHAALGKKYAVSDMWDTLLPAKLWREILVNGLINNEAISEAISNSRYFVSENRPDWVDLWHSLSLTDEEAQQKLSTVSARFRMREYEDVGVVRHVIGILLWLSDIGVYSKSKPEIVIEAKAYVDHLRAINKLPFGREALYRVADQTAWGGLGYFSVDSSEFKEVTAYFYEQSEAALVDSYPQEAQILLDALRSDTDKFFRSLVLCNHEDSQFYKTPLLPYIEPSSFVEVFMQLTQSQRRTVASTIEERYKNNSGDLGGEAQWLADVAQLLDKKRSERPSTISGHYIGLVAGAFRDAAGKVQATLEKNSSEER